MWACVKLRTMSKDDFFLVNNDRCGITGSMQHAHVLEACANQLKSCARTWVFPSRGLSTYCKEKGDEMQEYVGSAADAGRPLCLRQRTRQTEYTQIDDRRGVWIHKHTCTPRAEARFGFKCICVYIYIECAYGKVPLRAHRDVAVRRPGA